MLQQPPARHETTQPLIDFITMRRVMNSKSQSFYKVRSSVLAGLLGPTNKFTQPSDFGMSCLRTWPIRGSLAFFASPFKKPASPGAMTSKLCTLIPGIGHWPEWNCWDLRFDSLGHSHSQTHVSSFLLSAHRDVLPQSTVFCDSLVSCLQMTESAVALGVVGIDRLGGGGRPEFQICRSVLAQKWAIVGSEEAKKTPQIPAKMALSSI